jgi:hypothetical protein
MSTQNKRIVLQFLDMHQLWQFSRTLTCKSIQIDTGAKILRGDCSKIEINLALAEYSGKILEGELIAFPSKPHFIAEPS